TASWWPRHLGDRRRRVPRALSVVLLFPRPRRLSDEGNVVIDPEKAAALGPGPDLGGATARSCQSQPQPRRVLGTDPPGRTLGASGADDRTPGEGGGLP